MKHLPHRPENSAESFPTMNVNSSSNGLSWVGGPPPVPRFLFSLTKKSFFMPLFLANLILRSKADTTVAHFPCGVQLPQLTLLLVSYLASQAALNYCFICCHLLEEHSYFLVCVVGFSVPFFLRLVHFCHVDRQIFPLSIR